MALRVIDRAIQVRARLATPDLGIPSWGFHPPCKYLQILLTLSLGFLPFPQAFGAAGLCSDLPLAQAFAWARVLRLADGPDEVHKAAIAKMELKG